MFSLPGTTNGTAEAERGEDYKHIRLFTVGQGTQSSTPLPDLQTVEQNWTEAGKSSLYNEKGVTMSYFSSVCWFFGREISDGLENKVPIGLISNNWGGKQSEEDSAYTFEAWLLKLFSAHHRNSSREMASQWSPLQRNDTSLHNWAHVVNWLYLVSR